MEYTGNLQELGKKWNGKIYGGGKNGYSVYVNGEKVVVTEQQVKDYNNFLKQKEELAKSLEEITLSRPAMDYVRNTLDICKNDLVAPSMSELLQIAELLETEIYKATFQIGDKEQKGSVVVIKDKNDAFICGRLKSADGEEATRYIADEEKFIACLERYLVKKIV